MAGAARGQLCWGLGSLPENIEEGEETAASNGNKQRMADGDHQPMENGHASEAAALANGKLDGSGQAQASCRFPSARSRGEHEDDLYGDGPDSGGASTLGAGTSDGDSVLTPQERSKKLLHRHGQDSLQGTRPARRLFSGAADNEDEAILPSISDMEQDLKESPPNQADAGAKIPSFLEGQQCEQG